MKSEDLQQRFDRLVTGDITPKDHAALQQELKSNAVARAAFRERMDLEAGLRTWASESTTSLPEPAPDDTNHGAENRSAARWFYPILASAAGVLLVVSGSIWNHFANTDGKQLAQDLSTNQSTNQSVNPPAPMRLLGVIREQQGCQWSVRPVSTAGRFAVGKLALTNGIAELNFDSGTDVTLEGPCEINVTSIDGARLLTGNVCVHVSELSGGFTLETPESQIIDEGTQYAVSRDEESTEVHVFDGSVIWIPTSTKTKANDRAFEDRIEAGEAKSYSRSDPTNPKRIPFGQRRFVRELEDRIQDQADGNLLAYDGFENLAGRVRRGRSGFGWSDGWKPSRRGRGTVGRIIDAGDDVVFGLDRSQRQLISLDQGSDILRRLDQPLALVPGESIYISVLIERQSSASDGDEASLKISLQPDLPGRGRRLHQLVSFGVTRDRFPFVNSGNVVATTAVPVESNQPYMLVLKSSVGEDVCRSSMRLYAAGEAIDHREPLVWTVLGDSKLSQYPPAAIRLETGTNGRWQIDELRLGKTWSSVAHSSP